MLDIAYTGTQGGMTDWQIKFVTRTVIHFHQKQGIKTAHHGDCVGGDEQFHNLVRAIDPKIHIEIHPGDSLNKRALCEGDSFHSPLPNLERNKKIVVAGSGFLIAAPKQNEEIVRSGTWQTVRFARMCMRPVYIAYPVLIGWLPIETAPEGVEIPVKMVDGTEHIAHYAQNLSGEEQPAFRGWYVDRKTFMEHIGTPMYWRDNK